jgi:integrase
MLTDILIKKLVVPAKRREIPDGRISGLYLVVQPSGAKSWALRYRASGAPRKLTLGPYPAIDLATARKRAQEAIGDVAGGKDPAAAKRVARATARAAKATPDDLVENVVDDFVRLYASRKTRDWRETERLLKKDVAAPWRGKRLGEIERQHLAKLLDEIVARGAPVGANRVFAQIRKMCAWAVERGIIDRSPCEGVSRPSAETARDRLLSNSELALVWQGAGELGFPFGPIVRLLMLTGQRRDEVGALSWTELDLESALWTLPASRSKNRREHTIPLSLAAIEILRTLPRFERSPFIFSSGMNPPSGFGKAKERLDAILARLNGSGPMTPWTLHDIRRSVASGMAEINVTLPVIEKVLNHVSGSFAGIVGIYQRHDFGKEKRAALDAWARRLEAIVAVGGK